MSDTRDPEWRINHLLDPGTTKLISEKDKSGVLAATGQIKGNDVVVFASDPNVQGGALGPEGAKVIVHAYQVAMGDQIPIIGIWHSGRRPRIALCRIVEGPEESGYCAGGIQEVHCY